jgi:selenocysteine lyase/cysteine desulfurase
MGTEQRRIGFSADRLDQARALFPFTQGDTIYLNHASTSPLSTRVVHALTKYLQERSEGALETFTLDLQMIAECRGLIQRLINADSPDRIALFGNTSDAINVVASGIVWRAGDRILSNALEFPANVYPYLNLKRRGVELDFIPAADGRVTPSMIAAAITSRTRLVALSAVQFLSGYRADLAAIGELCHSRGIIFAVDGIQALGAISVDVQRMKIDVLAAGGQKWLMSPHGSGFLYVTEDLQKRLQQQYLGWLSVEDPFDYFNYTQSLASAARRYESGSLNIPSLWGFHASLSTLLEFGIEEIERQILFLTGLLTDQFQAMSEVRLCSPTEEQERAGIVTIDLPAGADHQAIFKALSRRKVVVALREGKLRFSPHFYNSAEEMQRAVAATRDVLAAPRM